MTFKEMLTAASAALPEVRSRQEYAAFCKRAVAFATDWTKNNRLHIQYVMKTCHGDVLNGDTIVGQKRPVAMGIVLIAPDGKMYAGGASQNPRDSWNRYIGQWHAIKRAQEVPADICELAYNYYTVSGDPHLVLMTSAMVNGCMKLAPELEFFNARLPSDLYAFPVRSRRAIIRCIGSIMFHRHKLASEDDAIDKELNDGCVSCECTCTHTDD